MLWSQPHGTRGCHVLLFPPEFTGNIPSWGPPLSHFLPTPCFRAHCMKIECSLSFTQGERTTRIDYDQIERPVYFDPWATETTFYMFHEGLTQLPATIRMQFISGLLAHLRCSLWCECSRLRSQWRHCLLIAQPRPLGEKRWDDENTFTEEETEMWTFFCLSKIPKLLTDGRRTEIEGNWHRSPRCVCPVVWTPEVSLQQGFPFA